MSTVAPHIEHESSGKKVRGSTIQSKEPKSPLTVMLLLLAALIAAGIIYLLLLCGVWWICVAYPMVAKIVGISYCLAAWIGGIIFGVRLIVTPV